jgi:DNA-directed RNA polymerase subunit L
VYRACEVAENICSRYANVAKGQLPDDITISPSNSRIIGFDFIIRGQDHTFGNLIQTWLVENHIEGGAEPKITYAGYSIPHPLRDEMLLRIGVKDGSEETARFALQEAARSCTTMFQQMRNAWKNANDVSRAPAVSSAPSVQRRVIKRPQVAKPMAPLTTVTTVTKTD